MRAAVWAIVACMFWVTPSASAADRVSFADTTDVLPGSLNELGDAKVPSGFVNFCGRQPGLCQPMRGTPRRVLLSPERWQLLSLVNLDVNQRIAAETDMEQYGQIEFWTLPGSSGDCEDYVLLKRRELVRLGFAESSLLITVVIDERGDGHAVLSIPTTSGDFILDNRRDEILPWTDVGYTFLKRQSAEDANRWVSLGSRGFQAANLASGSDER